MSIIASIIIAGSTVFVNTPDEALNYNPTADTLELNIVPRKVSPLDCYVNLTVREYTNLLNQVSVLWTAHTNRIASIKRHKERQEKQAALQKVRENVKKHKSAMGKSSGGVKK